MTAALGTLVFLAVIWLLVVAGASVLEQNGSKILAALKGKPAQQSLAFVPVRLRTRQRLQQPLRATAEWRAAA